eukprot:gene40236-49028_t
MASRNLTKKFVDMRKAAKASRGHKFDDHDRESGDGVLLKGGEQSNFKSLKNSLPPAWVEDIEKVEEDIAKIQLKVNELNNLHKKRLKVDFETDETQQEREIDSKTREITEVFRHAENLLKRFGKQSEAPGLTGEERAVRKNMQMSMAKKLQSLSMSFRSTQKQYMTQLQDQKNGGGAPSLDFLNETKKP